MEQDLGKIYLEIQDIVESPEHRRSGVAQYIVKEEYKETLLLELLWITRVNKMFKFISSVKR